MLRILHRMTPVLARTSRPFKPLIYPDDARNMSPDELDIFTLVQMVAFRLSGDVAAAMIYARRLQDRIVQIRVESRERPDGPLWFYHQQIGSTLLAAGETAAALLEFTTARDLGRLSPQADAERMALGRTALAHAVRGSLDDAESTLDEIALLPQVTHAHAASTMMTERCARALLAVDQMAPEAGALLSRLETYDSIELTWPFALLARTRHLLALQHPDDAVEAVSLARDAHPDQHGSFATDVINAVSIEALWSIGDTTSARRLADSSARSGVLSRMANHPARTPGIPTRQPLPRGCARCPPHGRLGPGAACGGHAPVGVVGVRPHRWRRRGDSRPGRADRVAPREAPTHLHDAAPADRAGAGAPLARGCGRLLRTHRRSRLRRPPSSPRAHRERDPGTHALPLHATTAEIAAALYVSPNTIKSQLRSLYRKLGCSTRDDAISVASRLRLLNTETSNRP